LAVWHGCAPSLLAAVVKQRPPAELAIMVARDPRGDALALLCRLLGLRVVRGDSQEGGWVALARLSHQIEGGACVLITADGTGPAKLARPGAVALSSTTKAPLVTVGADSRPAFVQRRKWDAAHYPLPFSRVALTIGEPHTVPELADLESIEHACLWLQNALDAASSKARSALGYRDLSVTQDL
jgi:lysophospholipid acyltransferase (LPLAT)-like uncharacterized protein